MSFKQFSVVPPEPVDDSSFVSSTVPEADAPDWVAGPYVVGNRVQFEHGVYENIESTTLANQSVVPPDAPLIWTFVGPTNRWAAYDLEGNTITSHTGTIEFVVTGQNVDTMGLLECRADLIRVRASSPTLGDYFDQSWVMPDQAIVKNLYDYFFAPIKRKKDLVIFDIPPSIDSTYTITLSGPSPVQIGSFVKGMAKEIGFTERGATFSVISFGRSETNEFGRRARVRRGYVERLVCQILADANLSDAINRELIDLRETPALYVAAGNSYDLAIVLGEYRDYGGSLTYPTKTIFNIEVEGI